MKKILILLLVIVPLVTFSQYSNSYGITDNTPSLGFQATVGLSNRNLERNYELEFTVKHPTQKVFVSLSGNVYNARTSDLRTHINLTPRLNVMLLQDEKYGLSTFVGYGKHWTGEGGKVTSSDPEIGIRFYKFALESNLTQSYWSLSPKFMRTIDANGNTINRFVVSIGIGGLL